MAAYQSYKVLNSPLEPTKLMANPKIKIISRKKIIKLDIHKLSDPNPILAPDKYMCTYSRLAGNSRRSVLYMLRNWVGQLSPHQLSTGLISMRFGHFCPLLLLILVNLEQGYSICGPRAFFYKSFMLFCVMG